MSPDPLLLICDDARMRLQLPDQSILIIIRTNDDIGKIGGRIWRDPGLDHLSDFVRLLCDSYAFNL